MAVRRGNQRKRADSRRSAGYQAADGGGTWEQFRVVAKNASVGRKIHSSIR